MFLGLRRESGFNIAEVAVAIVIFMTAIIGVAVVFETGSKSISESRLKEEAKAYATEKLEEIKRLPFYVQYNGTTNQDIDDFYYILTDAFGAPKTNLDQLTIPFNTFYTTSDFDYGAIAAHTKLKQKVRVQYQGIDAVTEQLQSPVPTMKTGWGPKASPPNDEPYDNAGTRLRLILIRVTMYYKYNGLEQNVTLDDFVSDSIVKFYPRVDTVTPNGVEQGTTVTLTIGGEGFTTAGAGPTVYLTKVAHSDIACTVTDHSLSTTVIVSVTLPASGMVGPGEDVYWNVKVINAGGMASTLEGCIYVIQNPPFIYYVDPTSGTAGVTWVKIVGQDFGVKRDANDRVRFNTTYATTYGDGTGGHTVWNNNIIWAQVPAGATSGNVVVWKGAVTSNGVAFDVGAGTGPRIDYINNVEPGKTGAQGCIGDRVRVYGANFGMRQYAGGYVDHVVFTSGINVPDADYSFWTDTVIECRVPTGAVTGNVYVHKNVGGNSNNVMFTIAPRIDTMNPTHGNVGTTVTLTGIDFGTRQSGENVVFTSGLSASINIWNDTTIVCTVPSGVATGNVYVHKLAADSNNMTFTAAPRIDNVVPISGVVGATVTITGGNFATRQAGENVVFTSGVNASISTWNNTQIVCTVPAGAVTGNIYVHKNLDDSNNWFFTVL